MLPRLGTIAGNPSSVHAAGQAAAKTADAARPAVARLIGARASEIVSTSGATEAHNIASHAALAVNPAATLIVTAVEHPAVLAFTEARRRDGHPTSATDKRPRPGVSAVGVQAHGIACALWN